MTIGKDGEKVAVSHGFTRYIRVKLEITAILNFRHGHESPNQRCPTSSAVLELAVAGGAGMIVTQNVRDFRRHELRFPEVQIITPFEFLKTMEA